MPTARDPASPPAIVLVTTAESAFGLPALRALLKLHQAGSIRFIGVLDAARPAYLKPSARLQRLGLSLLRDRRLPETVAAECTRLGVTLFAPPDNDLNSQATASFLQSASADYAVVFGCDQILRAPLLDSGPLFVNFHNSFLPEYRGVSATAWALLEGAKETGFTWHTIDDESIDEGRVVLQRRIAIPNGISAGGLSALISQRATLAIPEVVALLRRQTSFEPLPRGGRYYSRKQLDALRTLNPGDSPSDIVHRARILGAVEARISIWRLRLQDVAIAEEASTSRSLSIRIPLRGGSVRVRRINYLPALVFSPLVRMALRRGRGFGD